MILLRSTHDKVVRELEKDITVREGIIDNLRQEKKSLTVEINNEREIRRSSDNILREKLNGTKDELNKIELNNKILSDKNQELEEKIRNLEWCMQERDKTLEQVKKDNLRMYKKLEFTKELYRQFKWKCDKAMEIQFVTRAIEHKDVKKFLKIEDVLDLYTLIGMAGK